MFKKMILFMAICLLLPAVVLAQGITTASMNGTVKDQKGEPLVGANVVAVHEPSGSTFGAASRNDGRFNIPGVRVGGPYTITATYIGYKTDKQENVYLSLGQDLKIDFTLVEEAVELGEIVTVAERDAILSASNVGTATNVTTAQIERLPTITRTIRDFARLTPQAPSAAGGTSIAGKNNKYNNFQVDGAILDDSFGLDEEGFPTGQVSAQPISLDAIQEFQVQITPYDVRAGSFAGGLINAITRSGTNQFTGSGYFFGRNESLVGDLRKKDFGDFKDFQGGFRFGGPIIQNKVFFFVNGEIRRREQPVVIGINDPAQANNFPVPADSIQRVINLARNYGYNDVGGFDPFTNETNDQKIFARIDVNLSQRHRLTLRHNYVDGERDDGITRDTRTFSLESVHFARENTTNSTVLQLNSTLGTSLANEARVAYTTVRDKRTPTADLFPQVEVGVRDAQNRTLGTIRLGLERFSQANALDQDILEITDNVLYFAGNHTITIGSHNEFISYNNLFIQDRFGAWTFNTPNDFASGTPSRYFFSASRLAGDPAPRASWSYYQLGFYAQDEWKVNPKLNVSFGLRTDIPIMPDKPLENQVFETALNNATTTDPNDLAFPGRRTDEVPSGKILWSPRLGFNYDVTGNRTTQIRGGVGLFAGLPPGVWLSNQYSNTGVDFTRFDVRNPGTGTFEEDPLNQPTNFTAVATSEVNLTDKDFKLPQVIRTNIGIDHELQQGFIGTLEFLYSKNINDVLFQNLNIGNGGQPLGILPDGRPRYGDLVDLGNDGDLDVRPVLTSTSFTNVILMDNTSKGYSWNLTARVQKQLNRGPLANLFGSVSYTLSDAKDINSGRSSRAVSNWANNRIVDPNNPELTRSDFLVRHRILSDVSYQFNYGKGFGTTISLFYEGRPGTPFSYVFRQDINGDGAFPSSSHGHDLIFVPASANDLANPAAFDAINAFIESDEALKDARGKIFERNAAMTPWRNRLDLRVAQKVPSLRNQNFEITLDVLNFLNLLNDEWGEERFADFEVVDVFNFNGYVNDKPNITLNVTDVNADGKVNRDDAFQFSDLASRWQIQLGVRYSF